MCRNCRCLYVQVWNLWKKKIKENKDKKKMNMTQIYCVLSLCFVNEDWTSWYIQYLLLLDIESILVTLKKKKRCCIYFMWELFIMLECALWCHWFRSMRNHNGIKIKHGEMNSNVMLCIPKQKHPGVPHVHCSPAWLSGSSSGQFSEWKEVGTLERKHEFQNITTLYLQQKYSCCCF